MNKFDNHSGAIMDVIYMIHIYEGILIDGLVLGHIDPACIDTDSLMSQAANKKQDPSYEENKQQFAVLAERINRTVTKVNRKKLISNAYAEKLAFIFIDFMSDDSTALDDDGFLLSLNRKVRQYLKEKYDDFLKIIALPGKLYEPKKIEFKNGDSIFADSNINRIITYILTGRLNAGDDITDYIFDHIINKSVMLRRPVIGLCNIERCRYILKNVDIHGKDFLHVLFDAFIMSTSKYQEDFRRRVSTYINSL